ncbi:MAG: ParB/RepB/Spo0J family partition protein [Pseudomonadota bacterium]
MGAFSDFGRPPFAKTMDVRCLEPADVFVPERTGFFHEDKAVALGRLMAVDGQRDPIKVAPRKGKQPWKLVAGLHRLRGAALEGLKVYAIEVGGDDANHAELEASENLHRRIPGPIERAKFVAALADAARARIAGDHGDLSDQELGLKARWDRVKRGEDRVQDALEADTADSLDNLSTLYTWKASVADALGMSAKEVQRSMALYRLLIEPFPELAEPLSRHPIVGENASQLKLITGVADEANRRAVIEALLADPELDAASARIAIGLDAAPAKATAPHQKHFDAIEGAWARLKLAKRREFVSRIPAMLTPEMKRNLRDLLDEELGDV